MLYFNNCSRHRYKKNSCLPCKPKMIKKVTCSVKRGSFEESQHTINCIVVNQENQILFQSGEINQQYCLRSTLKPFQCAASLEQGTDKKYKLSPKEIAITCASHHGEAEHIKTVQSIIPLPHLNYSHPIYFDKPTLYFSASQSSKAVMSSSAKSTIFTGSLWRTATS